MANDAEGGGSGAPNPYDLAARLKAEERKSDDFDVRLRSLEQWRPVAQKTLEDMGSDLDDVASRPAMFDSGQQSKLAALIDSTTRARTIRDGLIIASATALVSGAVALGAHLLEHVK